MLPRGMRNYLSEVARVLKVNGKCLITMFLLNPDKARQVLGGAAAFQFPHRFRDCYVQDIITRKTWLAMMKHRLSANSIAKG